jgi:hypothetical protein
MKRVSLLAAVILSAALLAPGAGAGKTTSHAYKFNGVVYFNDLFSSDPNSSPASTFSFSLLVDDKAGTKQVGKGHGYCIIGSGGFSTCTAVIDDGKGKIVLTWEDDGNPNNTDQLAITGGTRRYRHLRGDGTSRRINPGDLTARFKLSGTL